MHKLSTNVIINLMYILTRKGDGSEVCYDSEDDRTKATDERN